MIDADMEIRHVIFIVYGRLMVVREMCLRNSEKKQRYKVDELSEMDAFGEYEAHYRTKSEFMLVADTSGAYFSLDHESLKESNHRILQIIKQKAIPYPD